MIDFSSALYLGFRHPVEKLRRWNSLTLGKPTSLEEPIEARQVAKSLAELIGCEAGVLLPSTLHAFWDLFIVLAEKGVKVFVDSGVYPIAWWGVERARLRGIQIFIFPHHDPFALRMEINKIKNYFKPVIVTDGFCPGCGKPAPLRAYYEIAKNYQGYLVIDDTQAFGILGEKKDVFVPYGKGGGGTVRWKALKDQNIIVVNSLAKGFGVPLTILASSREFIEKFRLKSQTLIHCSPPSIATISAAEHALKINNKYGDNLRFHLAWTVKYFKTRVKKIGINTTGGLFPVQTLLLNHQIDVFSLYNFLIQAGIRPLLHKNKKKGSARISFLIRTEHDFCDIERAVISIYQALKSTQGVAYEKHFYF